MTRTATCAKKFREIIDDPNMLWGMEIEPYDLFEKDTRLPLASINLANEEVLIAESCGRFRITIKGYDDDPRQVFDIPEVRGWFAALHKDAPHFPFFLEPELIVVYAAALLPHSYENAELKFEAGVIEGICPRVARRHRELLRESRCGPRRSRRDDLAPLRDVSAS